MTNKDIQAAALRQSAIDSNCRAADFLQTKNVIVPSASNPNARKYLALPFYCDLVSYGNNVVASVNMEIADAVEKYINKYEAAHCFETPNLHILDDALKQKGMQICFMADYFLPDLDFLKPLPCDYEIALLLPGDFADCYAPQWYNALCETRRALDMLAVAAYDGGEIIGLAGCSADCDTMWQIGIDVLPPYRQRGIAAALTSRLALEILHRGKVPFYCAAWSNVKSVRTAIKSGFRPAWVEITAKSIAFISELNR